MMHFVSAQYLTITASASISTVTCPTITVSTTSAKCPTPTPFGCPVAKRQCIFEPVTLNVPCGCPASVPTTTMYSTSCGCPRLCPPFTETTQGPCPPTFTPKPPTTTSNLPTVCPTITVSTGTSCPQLGCNTEPVDCIVLSKVAVPCACKSGVQTVTKCQTSCNPGACSTTYTATTPPNCTTTQCLRCLK